MSEEEEEWIENFLERSDITYTTPGKRNTVYVGMPGGKREYKQKRYLLWKLLDLLEIINGSKIISNEKFPSFTEAFEDELSFRQMYNFLKMHKVAYNSDIPHSPCLCEVCENASLLAKGINSNLKSSDILPTAHDLVETHTCDSSSKDCMLGNCPECLKPGLLLSDFKADVDLISFLQWQRVEKKTAKVNQTMSFSQVIPKQVETISNLKRHIYRKHEQVASYNKQQDELKTEEALILVDYSENYNNTQQDEIQSTYFIQQNFSIWKRSHGKGHMYGVGGTIKRVVFGLVKRSFNSNGVCFLEFYISSNDLEPFYIQHYSRAKTLVQRRN